MAFPIMFYTQVGTIIAFVVGLFVLYRLLVKNKDATIQLLENKISQLNEKIQYQGTDVLSKNLEERISILNAEIERLNQDKNINRDLIKKRKKELSHSKEIYDRLQKLISHRAGLTYSYFCPECNKPTIEYAEAKIEFSAEKKEHYLVKYSCGYSELNSEKTTNCENTLS